MATDQDRISSCLNIMRRMPPSHIQENLSGLLNLAPDLMDELLQRVDQPLEVATDSDGRQYLLCDYNRDGDSYRSPWTNTYDPPVDDGFLPSDSLRELETTMNEVFDAYRELYYNGGVSSVYLWDMEGGFAGCFLIKKDVAAEQFVKKGSWESIHVMEVKENGDGRHVYKLTTTIMLSMGVENGQVGDANLSGSLTRQMERTLPVTVNKPHVVNMGSLIEDMEIDCRSNLDGLYIQKTREVINSMRKLHGVPAQGRAFTMNLNAAVMNHAKNRKQDSET